jgi:hypothetical protein
MKRSYLWAFIAATFLASSAYAADMVVEKRYKEPPKTKQEAISRLEERIAELKKMPDEQWNAKHEEIMKRRAAWQARRAEKANLAPAAAAPAKTAPAAPAKQ